MRISDWSSDVCSSDLYAASTKARTTVIGGPNEMSGVLTDPDDKGERDYHWGDMWHYAIARVVMAERAAHLRPIDGTARDYTAHEVCKAQARRAAVLGCAGNRGIKIERAARRERAVRSLKTQ